jgi:hypothetical protein
VTFSAFLEKPVSTKCLFRTKSISSECFVPVVSSVANPICNRVIICYLFALIIGAGEGLLREQGRAEAGLPGIFREIPHQEIPARAASLLDKKKTTLYWNFF